MEDSTNISMSERSLLWTKDNNAIWIYHRPCSLISTENELKQKCERDWKSGRIVESPIITDSDQIKHLHAHIEPNVSATKYHNTKNILYAIAEMPNTLI